MRKLLLILSLLAFASTSAIAATTCVGDVSQYSGSNTCLVDGIEVGNFSVSPLAGKDVTISFGSDTRVEDNSLVLDFRLGGFNPPSAPGDSIALGYNVIGAQGIQFSGIDLLLPATAVGVGILEAACVVECASIQSTQDILAQIVGMTPGSYQSSFGGNRVSSFWVEKNIQFNGINGIASIASFRNGHSTAPEPTTGLLLGTALLGFVVWRRRQGAR